MYLNIHAPGVLSCACTQRKIRRQQEPKSCYRLILGMILQKRCNINAGNSIWKRKTRGARIAHRRCGRDDKIRTCGPLVPNWIFNLFALILVFFSPFRYGKDALRHSCLHCFRVLRSCLWSKMWSKKRSPKSDFMNETCGQSKGERFLRCNSVVIVTLRADKVKSKFEPL